MPGKDALFSSVEPCGEERLPPACSMVSLGKCIACSCPASKGLGLSLTYKEKSLYKTEYNYEWYALLQMTVKQAVQEAYQGRWQYSLFGDRSLAIDVMGIENIIDMERVEYAEKEEELKIYARILKSVASLGEIYEIVYQALAAWVEDYCVLIPLHTSEALQFWFLTGCESHGHIGRIILLREEHPLLQDFWPS